MCYYNSQKINNAQLIKLEEFQKTISTFDFLSNQLQIGFDYTMNAVLKKHPIEKDFDIVQMEWGFIPHYIKTREDVSKMRNGYKDASGRYTPPMITLNAVGEEILKPGKIFREAALKRRCLVLSTGFFEWRHIYPLHKKTGKPLKTANKYPYYISLKDRSYFFMAGIWQPWTDRATGEYVETFSVITTAANSLMSQIHNTKKRMPTILPEELACEWLLGDPDETRISEIATFQYPSSGMKACSIAKDFRQILEPAKEFAYEDLPALELNL